MNKSHDRVSESGVDGSTAAAVIHEAGVIGPQPFWVGKGKVRLTRRMVSKRMFVNS